MKTEVMSRVCLSLGVLIASTSLVHGQTPVHMPGKLQPCAATGSCDNDAPAISKAQELFDKGVAATKTEDYQLAIRYFDEADHTAPGNPNVWYNLGFAEANIPGRELRAMAWFGAFLAATPSAPNSAAILATIKTLDSKTEAGVNHLIDTLKEMSSKLPEERQEEARQFLAVLYAEAGRDDDAVESLKHGQQQIAYEFVAKALISDLKFGANTVQAEAWLHKLEQVDSVEADRERREFSKTQTTAAGQALQRKKMNAQQRARAWTSEMRSTQFDLYRDGPDAGLASPFFVDLPGYLKFLSDGGTPTRAPPNYAEKDYPGLFYAIGGVARQVIKAHSKIDMRLAEQTEARDNFSP